MDRLKQKTIQLLRWSERYTKTDMVYLAKGGSWLGAGQFITSLTGFFLSIAFANLFPKEAYGEYRYLFSVVGTAGALSLTGMDVALSQAVARGFDGTLSKSFKTSFIWSLLASSALLITSLYYFVNHNSTLGWGLIVAALATPLLKSFNLYGAFLLGKKDFGRRARYGMLYDVVPACAIALALFITNNTLTIVATYFITYALVSGVLYILTRHTYPSENAPCDETASTYSKHLSLMNFIGAVSFQLDKILTFHYLGAAQLAVYSFALAMPQQIRQIQKHLGTLAFPKFSEQSFETVYENIAPKAFRLFILMLVITISYILVAPFIFRLLFPQYMSSVFYSQLFSLVLLTAPVSLFKQALAAHKKTRELYLISTCLPTVKIIILFPLIFYFGITGAIGALLITELLGGGTSLWLFFRAQTTLSKPTVVVSVD